MKTLKTIIFFCLPFLIISCSNQASDEKKQEETKTTQAPGMMPGTDAFKPGTANADEDSQWTFTKAATLIGLGNYEEALPHINKYIEKNPQDGNGYFVRGYIFEMQQRYADALPEFKEALRLNAAHTYARMYKGEAHMYLKQYPEAFESFTRVIQLEPKNMYAYYNRGIVLSYLNKYKESVADFDVALAIDSVYAPALNNRGNAKYLLGDLEGACNDWRKSMKLGNVASEKAFQHYCQGKTGK